MTFLAIAVIVALAALLLYTTLGRHDTGRLSRDTLRTDRSQSPFLAQDRPLTGRDIEQRARERTGQLASTALATTADEAPAPFTPPDPETLGVTRRQFFNRSIVAMFGLGLSGFGAATLAFLWPGLSAGFGAKITAGRVDDLLGQIRDTREPVYFPNGRFYVAPFPRSAVSQARRVYSSDFLGMEQGVVALYQKCPHLGCRVPFCVTSQWFECPCHGSQYNRVGEYKGGPAPRGLDRFPVDISGGVVSVDTGVLLTGPAQGTNTTGQEAEGPHCVNIGAGE